MYFRLHNNTMYFPSNQNMSLHHCMYPCRCTPALPTFFVSYCCNSLSQYRNPNLPYIYTLPFRLRFRCYRNMQFFRCNLPAVRSVKYTHANCNNNPFYTRMFPCCLPHPYLLHSNYNRHCNHRPDYIVHNLHSLNLSHNIPEYRLSNSYSCNIR